MKKCIHISAVRQTCRTDQFQCANFECIPQMWRCDKEKDCDDGSDEQNCGCDADMWRCDNRVRVYKTWKCDGEDDCGDGSDEAGCGELKKHNNFSRLHIYTLVECLSVNHSQFLRNELNFVIICQNAQEGLLFLR